MPSRKLLVARHGERLDFVDASWIKSAPRPHDPPLTDPGRRMARELGERLATENIRYVFTSPFSRCVNTAVVAASAIDARLKVHIEPGMCEWLNAEWYKSSEKGPIWRTVADLKQEFDSVDAEYTPIFPMSHNFDAYPETCKQLFQRCRDTVQAVLQRLEKEPEGNILLVGHGSSVDALNQGLVPDIGYKDIPYCALSEFFPTEQPLVYKIGMHCDSSFQTQANPGSKPRYI